MQMLIYDIDGKPPLYSAIIYQCADILKLLLDANADCIAAVELHGSDADRVSIILNNALFIAICKTDDEYINDAERR